MIDRYIRSGVAAGVVAALCIATAGCGPKLGKLNNPVKFHPNVVYGKSPKGSLLKEDVYSPQARAGLAPVVIVIHGGGWTAGDKTGTDQYASALASVGYVAASVNYTLDKRHGPGGYPVQVREIQRAIQWNIAHAARFGGDPHRVALLGFSAGGYLAAMGGLLEDSLPGRPIDAVITLSAPFDFPAITQLLRQRISVCGYHKLCPQMPKLASLSAFGTLFNFLGCPTGSCSNQRLHAASPTSYVNGKSPRFLIFNSTDELIPLSQAFDMSSALRAAKVSRQVVVVQGKQHGGNYAPSVSPTIFQFLRRNVAGAELRLAIGTQSAPSSGPSTTLLIALIVFAVGSLGVVLLAMRRRIPRHL